MYCTGEIPVNIKIRDRYALNGMDMPHLYPCQSCGSSDVSVFYRVNHMPVHRDLCLPTREAALHYPQRKLRLGFCHDCGFMFNTAFDVTEQRRLPPATRRCCPPDNITDLHTLAVHLIERYDVRNRDILEIGCGGGEFLALMCEVGNNRGTGFDPQHMPSSRLAESSARDRIRIIRDSYSEQYADHTAHFICCRMTLDHIDRVGEFVGMLRRTIVDQPDTLVYMQVHNMTSTMQEVAFWNIAYEHCSYFSPGSLARLFRRHGFDLLDLSTSESGRSLSIVARPARGVSVPYLWLEDDLPLLKQAVRSFSITFGEKLNWWKPYLQSIKLTGERAVVWGAGAKTMAFLVTLGIRHEIDYVVDTKVNKHGTYLAVTGQRIVAPLFLRDYRPDTVIVIDRLCRHEIEESLCSMGLSPDIIQL